MGRNQYLKTMTEISFEHLHGEAAYLIWYLHNDCQVKLETLMAIDRNLELIITGNNDVLAYRYDHPRDMTHMVKDDGKWRYTTEADLLNPTEQVRLRMLCRDYSTN